MFKVQLFSIKLLVNHIEMKEEGSRGQVFHNSIHPLGTLADIPTGADDHSELSKALWPRDRCHSALWH